MKKLALVLAIAIIATFSAPAFAEHLVTGIYHLVAVSEDNGFNEAAGTDKDTFFFQRFRVPYTWKVNDNVSANLRLDFAEGTWGLSTTDSVWSRPDDTVSNTNELQVDRAHVIIKKDFYTVTVGQQFGGSGNYIITDHNFFGFDAKFDVKPVIIGLAYGKLDENGDRRDDSTRQDDNFYQATLTYKADTWSIGGAYAQTNDNDVATNNKLQGYGIFANAKVAGVNLVGEVDFFGGDQDATVKYDGMNVFMDASMPLSEMFTAGLSFVYGEGNTSATKTQVTTVHSAGAAFSVFDYGGKLKLEGLGSTGYFDGAQNVFELASEAGSLGFMGRLDVTITKEVQAYFRLGYAEVDESSVTTLDSKTFAIGNIDWNCIPNVWLSFGAGYVKPDYDNSASNDDANVELVTQLAVTF